MIERMKIYFRSPGAPREPEDPVPQRCDDGARPPDHHQGEAGQLRIPGEHHARKEVLHALQAVRGAAHQTGKRNK